MNELSRLLPYLLDIHNRIRASVVAATEQQTLADMAMIAHDGQGDTIYAIDRISEDLLVELVREAEVRGVMKFNKCFR